MEILTPKRSDLRRTTLLINLQREGASPLRKSSNNSPILNSSIVEPVNDEDEREHRRNKLREQKRLSSICTPEAVNLSESYISKQFHIYSHLFTENKITIKNAWNLKIIDLLKPLCQKSKKDVLQVASTSIDISAKVYGIRVDDIHTESIKLAGNMARSSENAVSAENDDGDDLEDQPEEAAASKTKKKKKKKSTGLKTTILKNQKACLAKLPKLEPVDFTTRVNTDTGTIDNLFTSILKESSSNFTLLDKNKKLLESCDNSVKNNARIPLNTLPLPAKQISICSPLHNFIVDQWDPEPEEKLLNEDSCMLSQIQPVVFDDNGFPIPELDGSIHDIFENNDASVDMDNDDVEHETEIRNAEAPQNRGNIAHVVDFRPMESISHCSEYSFNSIITTNNGRYIDQIWAGPSHWKLKCLRRSVPKFSGQKQLITEKLKRRKKAVPENIDFDVIPDIDFTKQLQIKKKACIDIDKITLPLMDQSCKNIMNNIKEFMLKPGVYPVEKKDKSAAEGDAYEVSPYNYENPNDSLYCSQSQHNDNDDADDVVGEEDHINNHDAGNLAEHLVDNPEMIENIHMQYVLKAKQMDMKKLKKAIWYKLTTPTALNVKTLLRTNTVIPQNFSTLYKALPDLLSQKEKQDLSCPLAFVGLLHLCNEQNLKLEQLPGYKDFIIKGPGD